MRSAGEVKRVGTGIICCFWRDFALAPTGRQRRVHAVREWGGQYRPVGCEGNERNAGNGIVSKYRDELESGYKEIEKMYVHTRFGICKTYERDYWSVHY